MLNSIFVVWRESFEAILIVGILFNFLSRRHAYERSKKFLWVGVGLGLALSALIAFAIQNIQTELQGRALEIFDASLLLTAAVLMTQMCIWMKRHGRMMKTDLETGADQALSKSKLTGICLLAALAIAREGAELVVFFYGMGLEAKENGQYMPLVGSFIAGLTLSAFSAVAYFKGLKIFNARRFFQITSIFLLLTASSLLLSGIRKFIQIDLLSPIIHSYWDTSFLLDDRSHAGQFANTLFGYEATPSLTVVIATSIFWIFAALFYWELPKLFKSQILRAKQ